MSDYNPRGGYESRSMLNEAIANRVVREFELESLYKGSERAAVEIMHKYDGTRQEMAWVLQGDEFTKSTAVYDYIDSIIKEFNPSYPGKGLGRDSRNEAMSFLGLGEGGEGKGGLSGGASQGTAGGNMQSHQAAPSKPGLGQRLKTWASERAAPAMRRGMQHLGSAVAGGMMGGPLGALGGLGASMYANRNLPKQPVFRGEGGLGQIAGDAARQGGQAMAGAAQQQAQNFQTGQGAMGRLGQIAGTARNLGGAAMQGMRNMGQAAMQGVQNAYNQAGQQQQANAAAQQQANLPSYLQPRPEAAQVPLPDGSTQPGINTAPSPQGPGTAPPVPLPGAQATPTAASGAPVSTPDDNQGQHEILTREPTATVDPALVNPQSTFGQNAGMFAGQVKTSNDTFNAINAILKGW